MKELLFSTVIGLLVLSGIAQGDDPIHRTLGKEAPQWKDLEGVDDKKHSSSDYADAKATVVVFLCNHCPCARGYQDRFKEFTKEFEGKGVRFIAFNADTSEDLAAMKERASDAKFNFDYYHDAGQKIAKGFGAKTTPHIFVLDHSRKIVFSGAFDNDKSGNKVTKTYVHDVVTALLEGKEVPVSKSPLCGCGISYEN